MLRYGVILAGVLLCAAGCGSNSRSTPSRPTVNATGPIISATPRSDGPSQAPSGAEGVSTAAAPACPLASAAAITGAFGARIAAQVITTSGKAGQQCRITLASSNLGPGITLYLSRISPTSAATFNASKRSAVASGAQAIGGLGQSAYYTPAAHNLQYLSGTVAGGLSVTSTNPAVLTSLAGQVRADLIALATKVIAEQ